MPERRRLVPVAESQLKVKTASSGFSALTIGGALMTALWRPGTSHFSIETPLRTFGESFLPPFRTSLTCGRPHAKTKTESRIQGIQAIRARFGVWTGRFAASAARSSLFSCAKLQVFFGCQNFRRRTVAPIETMAPAMSTTQGPW